MANKNNIQNFCKHLKMDKKSVGKISVIILIGLVLSVSIYFVLANETPEEPEESDWQVWKTTPTTQILRNSKTGQYQRTIGQGIQFIDDKTRRFPNYVQFNETFFSLINSTDPLFDYELDQYYEPGWNVYFKKNPTQGQVVKYIVNETEITFQPMALNYRNDYSQLQQISMIQSVVGINNTNKFTYPNAYGSGIDLQYENRLGILKENLVINSFSDLSEIAGYIEAGQNPTLDLDFIISSNGKLRINGEEWDKSSTVQTSTSVQITDELGNVLYSLPTPIIQDSSGNEIIGGYEFKKSGQSLYIILKTNYTWLKDAVYPVYIDPTITLQEADTENLEDAYVGNAYPDDNSGVSTSLTTDSRSSYLQRSYLKFNLLSLPSVFSLNASLSLYHYIDQGTDNISIHHVYVNDWNEGSGGSGIGDDCSGQNYRTNITWNNQPCGINFDNASACNLTEENKISISSVGWHNWSISNMVKNATTSNFKNISFVIKSTSETTDIHQEFTSKEGSSSSRPKLTITYTPYIDIITPTPAQIFTDDEPTARFNVTTAVAMGSCHWTPDSGATNYTMTNHSEFNWTLKNTSMVDGAHTITFSCNESSDGTWRTSDSVSFDVDSVNVTVCRDLSVSRTYELRGNISEYSSIDCFDIIKSINFSGNSFNISYNSSLPLSRFVFDFSAGAINRIYDLDNIITNVSVFDLGIKTIITNINYVKSGGRIINYPNDNTNVTLNKAVSDTSNYCVTLGLLAGEVSNVNISIQNLSCSNGGAFYIQTGAINHRIYDTLISSSTEDIIMGGSDSQIDVVNVTYYSNVENINSSNTLIRKWYFETNITDENGVDLEDVNVTIFNVTGDVVHSELTDSSGEIGKEELTEYINNGGSKTYHTPHTINVSLDGYATNSTIVNLTEETNWVHHVKLITILSAEIYYPTDYLWISDNSSIALNFNYTNVTELDTCLFTLDDYITNITITDCVNTTFDKSDGNYLLKLWINDTTGTAISDSVNFTIDSTPPLISYGTGTEDNETNFTRSWVYVNVSVTEGNEKNITFKLYYKNGTQKNSTTYTTSQRTINWTNLIDGFYNYNVSIYDYASNVNSTLTRRIGLDNVAPSLKLDRPLPQSYSSNQSLPLNFTVTDATLGVQSCWYRIVNSTSDVITSNTTLSNCANITFNVSQGEGTFTLTLYSNDSLNNVNSSSVTFGISLIAPAIVLDYPTDNLWLNSEQNIYFNFTSTDLSGLDTCSLYGNWTGTWHKNYTWKEPNSGVQNYTILNLSDMEAIWNVWCNDTLNNGDWALNNFTFGIDTIFPTINLTSISTTIDSKIIYFNSNTSDTNTLSCKYSIFHTNGSLDGTNENISYTCNAQGLATVQGKYGTYDLTIYSSDPANNENKTTGPFTISQSPRTGSGGGGNGEPEEEEEEEIIIEAKGICGNGICEAGETFANCPFDCGEFNLDDLIFSCFAGTPIGDWLDVEDTPEIKSRCITNQAPVLFWIFIVTISGVSFVVIIEKQKAKGKIYKFPQYYETRRKAKSWLRRHFKRK